MKTNIDDNSKYLELIDKSINNTIGDFIDLVGDVQINKNTLLDHFKMVSSIQDFLISSNSYDAYKNEIQYLSRFSFYLKQLSDLIDKKEGAE